MKTPRKQNFKLWTGVIVLLLLSFVVLNTAFAGELWDKYSLGAKSLVGSAVGKLNTNAGNYIKSTNFGVGAPMGKFIDTHGGSTVKSSAIAIKTYAPQLASNLKIYGMDALNSGGSYLTQVVRYTSTFNTKSSLMLSNFVGKVGNGLSSVGRHLGILAGKTPTATERKPFEISSTNSQFGNTKTMMSNLGKDRPLDLNNNVDLNSKVGLKLDRVKF